jgi:hypothetical protein
MSSKSWTTVGKKGKCDMKQDDTPPAPATAPATDEPVSSPPVTLCNFRLEETKSPAHKALDLLVYESKEKKLEHLCNLVAITLDMIETTIASKTSDIKNIKDNQQAGKAINVLMPTVTDCVATVENAQIHLRQTVDALKKHRSVCVANIQQYLQACGWKCIPIEKKKSNVVEKKSYASMINTPVESSLVVQKLPVKVTKVNNTNLTMIFADDVNMHMPICGSNGGMKEYTLTYDTSSKNSFIKMNGTVYTCGPSNFIEYKKGQSFRAEHAKRCHNAPCKFSACKYYHDPMFTSNASQSRTFVMSYVNQLLREIKNNDDVLNNPNVRDKTFVRDLVQLAGTILFRASQIKTLYFEYSM